MASVFSQEDGTAPVADNASDYGSDLDDATAFDLLSQAESQPLNHVVLESVYPSSSKLENIASERRVREASVEVEYDEGNRLSFSRTYIIYDNTWSS